MLNDVNVKPGPQRIGEFLFAGPSHDLLYSEIVALGILPLQKSSNDPNLVGDLKSVCSKDSH
jgi:hypothetical protein